MDSGLAGLPAPRNDSLVLFLFLTDIQLRYKSESSPSTEGRSAGEAWRGLGAAPAPTISLIVVPGVLGQASRRIMTPRARSLRLPGGGGENHRHRGKGKRGPKD